MSIASKMFDWFNVKPFKVSLAVFPELEKTITQIKGPHTHKTVESRG